VKELWLENEVSLATESLGEKIEDPDVDSGDG
jgi:hypothetical protein